jgi:hypothetical protein
VIGSGLVLDGEVVLGKKIEPMDLAVREARLRLDVTDSPVVTVDSEVLAKVVTPDLEGLESSEELEVVGRVSGLGGGELGGVVGDDALCVAFALGEDGTDGVVGGVGMDREGLREVGWGENGSGGEGGLEIKEGGGSLGAKGGTPIGVAGKHGIERGGDGRVTADEATVVVGKPKEGAEVRDGGGKGPGNDGGNLGGVGGDAVFGDNMAHKFNSIGREDALGGVGKEVVVLEELEGGREVAGMVLLVF